MRALSCRRQSVPEPFCLREWGRKTRQLRLEPNRIEVLGQRPAEVVRQPWPPVGFGPKWVVVVGFSRNRWSVVEFGRSAPMFRAAMASAGPARPQETHLNRDPTHR